MIMYSIYHVLTILELVKVDKVFYWHRYRNGKLAWYKSIEIDYQYGRVWLVIKTPNYLYLTSRDPRMCDERAAFITVGRFSSLSELKSSFAEASVDFDFKFLASVFCP